MSKKTTTLREISLPCNINCTKIGRKSGQVVAIGDDDKNVTVWHIGSQDLNPLRTLTGLPSPVTCVGFDPDEVYIVAGSEKGSLKLWDLEQQKVARSIPAGHRSHIHCVDFHPFGYYFASGGSDTNLKVWDIRRKNCLQKYKGHSQPIRTIRFTPDGKWLVSGGPDGSIKLWDLTAGKLLHDFYDSHTNAVTCLDFHPNEFLLATGSADKTVKFWDLDNFQLVSTTELNSTNIRAITFSPDGRALFSGSNDNLKVWGWEPSQCYECLPVDWNGLDDLILPKSVKQLVGVSISQNVATISVVFPGKLAPWNSGVSTNPNFTPALLGGNVQMAKNDQKLHHRPITLTPSQNTKPSFKQVKNSGISNENESKGKENQESDEEDEEDEEFDDGDDMVNLDQDDHEDVNKGGQKVSDEGMAKVKSDMKHIFEKATPEKGEQSVSPAEIATRNDKLDNARTTGTSPPDPKSMVLHPQQGSSTDAVVPSKRDKVIGMNLVDFLPKNPVTNMTDEEIVGQLLKQNENMCTVLNSRLVSLRIIKKLWQEGEMKEAVETLTKTNDMTMLADFMKNVMKKDQMSKITLDVCVSLLPLQICLLQSKFEDYIIAGLRGSTLLYQHFSPLILVNLQQGVPSVGIDLQREARLEKCTFCFKKFEEIKKVIDVKFCSRKDNIGFLGRELRSMMLGTSQK